MWTVTQGSEIPGNASNDDFLLGYGVRTKRGEGICGGEEEGITIRDFGFTEGENP